MTPQTDVDSAMTDVEKLSLAVSALKAAAYALRSPDAHRRQVVSELVIACLTQMGETIGEIP